jgi:hypothetical protein
MADLRVTLTEDLSLKGHQYGGEKSLTISGINEVLKRVVTCPANSETTIAIFHSSVADGTLAPLSVSETKYIRVTNLDTTNSITLSLQVDVGEDDSGADESASLLLGPQETFMLGTPHDAIGVSDANANLVTDLVDLESIVVQPGSNIVNVEILVAGS